MNGIADDETSAARAGMAWVATPSVPSTLAQAIGAQLDPGWQILAGHIAFLIVLAVRPQGLFPKVRT